MQTWYEVTQVMNPHSLPAISYCFRTKVTGVHEAVEIPVLLMINFLYGAPETCTL